MATEAADLLMTAAKARLRARTGGAMVACLLGKPGSDWPWWWRHAGYRHRQTAGISDSRPEGHIPGKSYR